MNKIKIYNPNKVVRGNITLNGSKSISNRVLIIRALCDEKFDIQNLSDSDDSTLLQQLINDNNTTLDAHHAGTTFRFLTAYLALREGVQILTGSSRMKKRPIGDLVEALRSIGADIVYIEEEGFPPLQINAFSQQKINSIKLSTDISSQFVSALLLVAPTLPQGLRIEMQGTMVSKPYINMTINIMREFGVEVYWEGEYLNIASQKYSPKSYFVEADWSSASYIYAIASLVEEAEIDIIGLNKKSFQGDSVIVDIFKNFGVETRFENQKIQVFKSKGTVVNPYFEYNFLDQPDLAQTISVCCAGLGISALFSGLQTLKIKETDRIAALQNELIKFGVVFTKMPSKFSKNSGVEYYMQEGKVLHNSENFIQIETYQDHRMAMAFAPLSVFVPLEIENPDVVSKSYPNFWLDLKKLGFDISIVNERFNN